MRELLTGKLNSNHAKCQQKQAYKRECRLRAVRFWQCSYEHVNSSGWRQVMSTQTSDLVANSLCLDSPRDCSIFLPTFFFFGLLPLLIRKRPTT